MLTEILGATCDFLQERGWTSYDCSGCGSIYYAKKPMKTCQSFRCEGGVTFPSAPSPKKFMMLDELSVVLKKHFHEVGYSPVLPIEIVREDERTLFASTVGQVFDEAIYLGVVPPVRKVICIQPVIRLQGAGYASASEGNSTSFLNAGTETWQSSIDEHLASLDSWLDLFSQIGLYVGDITLKRKEEVNDWDGTAVNASSLKINYRGLEIGIANYFSDIAQPSGKSATQSDVGIGVERVAWAVNKTHSYFDAIGPIYQVFRYNAQLLDSVRTATLMITNGILPGPRNHSSKLRVMLKQINPLDIIPFEELVSFYHAQWVSYLSLAQDVSHVAQVIRSEHDRNRVQEVARLAGMTEREVASFLGKAINNTKDIDRLRNVIGKK